MEIQSGRLFCKVILTHEDALHLNRYLQGCMHGGEMSSHDLPVVKILMAGLNDHEEAIQRIEADMKKPVRVEVNEQVGIYQVLRD